ncbi:hypothetical protein MRX96_026151 [Rhipicephalus microplus]
MKMTEVEREAKIVVESLVSTVSSNTEMEHLVALLRNMSAYRQLFHHTRTVYDLNSQTTQKVNTDFMGGLSFEARIIYSTETGLVVLPEQRWLACSPDGLMRYEGNTVFVEMKCPARCEKVRIIEKEEKTILEFFDCLAGTLTLKKSHIFYTKLQLQLYIMNLSQAVF